MKYSNIHRGRFLERPNRFIAYVDVKGDNGYSKEKVHVKNTGRCKELLVPGATVYLEHSDKPERKTAWDLIAVEKEVTDKNGKSRTVLINMDSQAPNAVTEEWLKSGALYRDISYIKRECKYGDSRFDFYLEREYEKDGKKEQRKMFLEVKGVTLEKDGLAMFPDAPTERGIKHIRELIHCIHEGYDAAILFVVQMEEAKLFRPNIETQAQFAEALRDAESAGVKILVHLCKVTPDSLRIAEAIPYELK